MKNQNKKQQLKRKNNKNKNKKRRRKRKSFFNIVFRIFVFLLVVSIISLTVYSFFYDNKENDKTDQIVQQNNIPDLTNVLIVGVDNDETRTDTIMLASYNNVLKEINIISIPRDTLVSVNQNDWNIMLNNFPALSGNRWREIKINSVHNYGKEQGIDILKRQIESILNINIDYYVKVNFKAFRYIIDSLGGIEFDVPERMYYQDPTQDLYINLKPGLQVLDGDKAEQLVRFRGYAQADLQRVVVQQEFLKTFLKTLINKENILSNPMVYLKTIIKYIDTDFKINDALKYMSFISDLNSIKINTYTLPGEPEYRGGVSYFILDESLLEEMVYEIFEKYKYFNEDIVYEDSYNKSIAILNGSHTKGLAKKTKDNLTDIGYTISFIGDWGDSKSDQTRIYVKKPSYGNDLEQYFNKSKIIVSQDITRQYGVDIVIVIGKNES